MVRMGLIIKDSQLFNERKLHRSSLDKIVPSVAAFPTFS